MHKFFRNFLIATLVYFIAGCNKNVYNNEAATTEVDQVVEVKYSNPVFEPILADPTIIKADDGFYYGYGTEDNWGDGNPGHLVAVVRSRDMVNWSFVRDAFSIKPTWKKEGGIWAPDVVKVKERYHLYYSYSTWGDTNPGIGLASSSKPAGPYADEGKIFLSSEIGVPNSIDPFYFEDNDKKYLFWGSYSWAANQGTYGIALDDEGKAVAQNATKFKIAAGDFEAVVIHKRGPYYYFIGSKGGCCAGEKSTYHLLVARAEKLQGPYLDKEGKDVAIRGNGTILLEGNASVAGPGHSSRIITDDKGTDWLFYHGILKINPTVSSGASRRTLMIDKITWENDWPTIAGNTPSTDIQKGPVIILNN